MNLANFIFYVLLFIGFFLPTNSNMYIPFPGVLLKVNELAFLLLPIVNFFCTSSEKKNRINRNLSKYIILYILIVIITELLLKPLVFGQSLGDSVKSLRVGLPFMSSIIMLYFGIKANIKTVWKVLLYAIGVSIVLSIISIYVDIPIYYNIDEQDILEATQGRIMNSNASFGIIGLYLLFSDKDKWYNEGKLVKYVSILSVIMLILTFNRTYLALLVLEFLYLARNTISFKTISKLIFYPLFLFIITFFVYQNNDTIQRQIDKRILSIVFQENSLKETTIDGNRDMIYEGVLQRINEGYWFLGLPYNTPIYINTSVFLKDFVPMNVTDTSLINVLLKYGIFPLFLFCLIFKQLFRIFKQKDNLKIILIVYFLASLNIDSLFRHNSVFFIVIIISLISLKIYDKNNLYSQN